ncbi:MULTISPECIES: SAM-dependent methyltransferase [Comamonas]|uniref:SAM-dependent methyltransferase n=1 Tax=Comamonas TaxID=283 RepID=UPI00057AD396|nr:MULTISPECIES: cyclopropane-fatty-acyl-phospholipid synthase family protein [Comamonas]KKI14392.1 cyclopropane-fatty-acyl-phospholipid synthase [Comamonas thiooxydans]MBL5977675.1 class I SAM-dependent methyltransferase [Comamonas sp. NyZ500]MDH1252015.1 cyclopropane-fatty-acyl-phospholipid synthase family protein [Comamonas thiooxydans]QOQ82511.1 class I SAM-dependent methyltransferase [Comamonas thiooxydans]UUE93009.1 cyclopropane-fatty-acyl-phospholipid synthase family protein [Comamonas 
MLDRLTEKLLQQVFAPLVKTGRLEVTTPSGKALIFGDGGQPQARLRFADRRAVIALLRDPDLNFGELFMQQRLLVEQGTVYDVLELVLRGARHVPVSATVRLLDAWRMKLRPLLQNNLRGKSRANVAHHYDLDDRLYQLFLDSERQYSCAYFEQGNEDLETAQLAKKRHIAAKLLIEPGQRVLDIGCGWGGLSRYLAEVGGAGHVTGITLSTEQLAGAQSRASQSIHGERLEYRLEDYRDTQGPFERIVSVGMFEHVGTRFHDAFFRKCHELLSEDGVMLLHFIGNSDVPDFNNPWIERYIFPGGHIPSMSEFTPAIERAGLVICDIEVLRLHYAQTLRLWRERFMARRAEAAALYDERFCRMWEFYLSMSETAFRYQDIAIFQVQLARRQDAVPLTRSYIAERETALKARESGQKCRVSAMTDPTEARENIA